MKTPRNGRGAIVLLAVPLFITPVCAHWSEAAAADQASIYPQTAAEKAAGITPVDRHYPAGDVRRYGAVHNDDSEDTLAIQAALDVSAGLVAVSFQPGTYLIGRLEVPGNTTMQLPSGCVLKDTGKLPANKRLINISSDNIRILGRGAIVEMSRKDYTSGEQRHGVFISGADNVYIEGLESSDSGGDGFYIGASARKPFSSNIQLVGVIADNNRRQGLSIVSAKNVRVVDSSFTNTSGTRPSAGIDIEPNNNSQYAENIVLQNIRTEGNDGAGITMFLNNLVGPVPKAVSIRITGHRDRQSAASLAIHKLDLRDHSMNGTIVIERPVSIEPDSYAIVVRNFDVRGPAIHIVDPEAIRPNAAGHVQAKYGSAFAVFRDTADSGANIVGNVTISNPRITDDRTRPITRRYIFVRDLSRRNGIRDVHIDGTISATGIDNPAKMIEFDAAGRIEDRGRLLVQNVKQRRFQLRPDSFAKVLTNADSKHSVSVQLSDVPVGWPDVRFETRAPHSFSVFPESSSRIVFEGSSPSGSVHSQKPGSALTLRRTAPNLWTVVSSTGDWQGSP